MATAAAPTADDATRARTTALRQVPVELTCEKLGLLYDETLQVFTDADDRFRIKVDTATNKYTDLNAEKGVKYASGTGSIDLACRVLDTGFKNAAEHLHATFPGDPPQRIVEKAEKPAANDRGPSPEEIEAMKARTEALRQIPIELVAAKLGMVYEKQDKQWHDGGRLMGVAIDETNNVYNDFKNSDRLAAGGGAIDFVMHYQKTQGLPCSFKDAAEWLHVTYLNDTPAPRPVNREAIQPRPAIDDQIVDKPDRYHRVSNYLWGRGILPSVIKMMRDSGILLADDKANAVFVGKGEDGKIHIAEKRGTSTKTGAEAFRQTNGSRDFCVQMAFGEAKKVAFFESAIDMASYVSMRFAAGKPPVDTLFVSTAGVRNTVPKSLHEVVKNAREVVVAYDADKPGDEAAIALAASVSEHGGPNATRARPSKKDWNDVLNATQRGAKPDDDTAPRTPAPREQAPAASAGMSM